jgi:hypothetical protein
MFDIEFDRNTIYCQKNGSLRHVKLICLEAAAIAFTLTAFLFEIIVMQDASRQWHHPITFQAGHTLPKSP